MIKSSALVSARRTCGSIRAVSRTHYPTSTSSTASSTSTWLSALLLQGSPLSVAMYNPYRTSCRSFMGGRGPYNGRGSGSHGSRGGNYGAVGQSKSIVDETRVTKAALFSSSSSSMTKRSFFTGGGGRGGPQRFPPTPPVPVAAKALMVVGGAVLGAVVLGIGSAVLTVAVPAAIAYGVWRKFLRPPPPPGREDIWDLMNDKRTGTGGLEERWGRPSSLAGAVFGPALERMMEEMMRRGAKAAGEHQARVLKLQKEVVELLAEHEASPLLGHDVEVNPPHAFAEQVVNGHGTTQMSFAVLGSRAVGEVTVTASSAGGGRPLRLQSAQLKLDGGRGTFDLMQGGGGAGRRKVRGGGGGEQVVDAEYREKKT